MTLEIPLDRDTRDVQAEAAGLLRRARASIDASIASLGNADAAAAVDEAAACRLLIASVLMTLSTVGGVLS